MDGARPDVVFHLAAQVDVRRSVADPEHDLAVNVGGTLKVLEAARDLGVRHLVFASTGGAIYGDCDVVPTPEEAPERPLAPYGQAKLAAEGYLRLLGELYGVPTTSLRFANVYGPRQDPLGEGGVCAIFCGAAVMGRPVTVFGSGEQTRDFVFVGDVVDACLAAADGAPFGPYNVGTGVETSVNGLAARLGLEVERAPARQGEVERSCLDPSRIADELGWRAQVTLADGLERTLAWARAQPS
jgi:UDP-glucose 4-epimerase